MKKGFTLVELLAVIVILAVIALITIPAVMKMIESSTMNSYRRSIDLYGKSVNNAVIEYQTDMVEKGQPSNVTFDNIEPYIEYEGNDVDCKIKQIYSDKTILLTECYVEEELVAAEKNRGYGNENYYYYTNSKNKMKAIEYIKAVEEELKDKNISGTCTIAEDKLTCNEQDFTIKSNLENAIEGTLIIENSKVKSYSNLKFETEKKVETNNEVPQVIDEENTSNENNNQENIVLETKDYRGYYADIDNDGTVDGVIYADLAYSSGEGAQFGDSNVEYSYTSQTNLKKYTVSNTTYKANDGFGTKPVISIKNGSSGNPRFYIMALENFTISSFAVGNGLGCGRSCDYETGTYYWYKNAYEKMIVWWDSYTSLDFGTGYANTGKMIEIWNKNGIGEGSYLDATQDDHDIFKHIQIKYQQGWYIPSRGEWAAFAVYLKNKMDNPLTKNCFTNTCIVSGNYNSEYGLSNTYWTSSQGGMKESWIINFMNEYMSRKNVDSVSFVRLGATF